MKYKIYIVKTDEVTKQAIFIEADFNLFCGFDTIDEANNKIQNIGDDYTYYVILPYVYMTSYSSVVSNSSETTCSKCNDRGCLYDNLGNRTGTCPCHY